MGRNLSYLKTIFANVFIMICIVGFSFQLAQIAFRYFSYLTLAEITLDLPTRMAKSLSFCPRYIDVMDYEKYQLDNNVTLKFLKHKSGNIGKMQAYFTIKEIFEYTPSVQDVFYRCFVRKPSSYAIIQLRGKDCYELFNVSKFYHQEYICYTFNLISHHQSFSHSAYALYFPGMLFLTELKPSLFDAVTNLKVIAHLTTRKPYVSLAFAPFLTRGNDSFVYPSSVLNSFKVTYSSITVKFLPPPYVTNCFDYQLPSVRSSQQGLITKCIEAMCKVKFNKVQFRTFIKEPIDYKHITHEDINNETFATELKNIEDLCADRYPQPNCEESYILTHALVENYRNFRLGLHMPLNFEQTVRHKATLLLNEFLLFAFSCFGTWFGVSIMALNPFRFRLIHKFRSVDRRRHGKSRFTANMQTQFVNLFSEIALLKSQINRIYFPRQPIPMFHHVYGTKDGFQ